MSYYALHHGDCLDVLRGMADNSVDSVVTDPPYGLNFMGKKWDCDVPSEAIWVECLRVLKPGGHLLAFAGTRTQHRMACRIEDAGFEIRDMIAWLYGSGFPKSHNGAWGGTALKPALEPITVARKPLMGTVAVNWSEHGTGSLNIEGCRIARDDVLSAGSGGIPCRHDESLSRRAGEASALRTYEDSGGTNFAMSPGPRGGDVSGRWPANLIHDGSDEVLAVFPLTKSGSIQPHHVRTTSKTKNAFGERSAPDEVTVASDGSAARFFYCAKADATDRDAGLHGFETRMPSSALARTSQLNGEESTCISGTKHPRANTHPTVKPTDLMRYLCRLVTPPGGVVLDPFNGSGSTGKGAVLEGFFYIGIEREAEHIAVSRARIDHAVLLAKSGAAFLKPATDRDAHTVDLFGEAA